MKTFLNNIVFLLLLISTVAKGQYASQNGWFTVNEVKGCAGLTINISIDPAKAPCSNCDFDYDGDGTYDPKSNPLTYTYTDPGNYTLEVLFPNPDGSDYINITVTDNIAPAFNIYSCPAQNVVIDIADNNFDNYIINYDDGTQDTIPQSAADPRHGYSGNTSHTVELRGFNNNAADNCAVSVNDVTPIKSIPTPAITLLTQLDDSSLALQYDLSPDIQYELQISPSGNGSYSFLKYLVADDPQDTIRNLSLANRYACFRIAARDPCSNTVSGYSNEICSIDLALVTESDVNKLNWKTANPDLNFSLQRDDGLNSPVAATARSYDDTAIECNVDYCYTLVGNYNNGYRAVSLLRCGAAFSTTPPEPVNNISIEVKDNNIIVAWEEQANAISYQVSQSNNGNSSIVRSNNRFEETGLATSRESYCYQIGVADTCGNSTAGELAACSILLTGQALSDNTIPLTWNAYKGWENGVAAYRIEKYYPTGASEKITTNEVAYTDTDNSNEQIIRYKVFAEPSEFGLTESVSNIITVIKPVNIYYPDAFTPDGNGTNDIFQINARFIESFVMRIFNRWGEMVYFSEYMSEGWNGMINGQPAPEGTYIFNADLQDMAGRRHNKEGSILLLRR